MKISVHMIHNFCIIYPKFWFVDDRLNSPFEKPILQKILQFCGGQRFKVTNVSYKDIFIVQILSQIRIQLRINIKLQFHDLDTELDHHRFKSGFHVAFAMGVASQQGTLTLPDTWFRPPFLGLAYRL